MVTQALWVLLVLVGGGAAAPFLHSHPLHPALTMKRFVDFGTKSSNSWQPNTGVSTSLISSSSLLQSSPLIKSSPLIQSSRLQSPSQPLLQPATSNSVAPASPVLQQAPLQQKPLSWTLQAAAQPSLGPSSPLQRSLPSSTPAALQRLQRTNSLEWEVRLHPEEV